MKRGFSQISILLTIIVVVLIISGGGYIGVKQYQKYQKEKSEKGIMLQEKERELQKALIAQQKSLEDATMEIEKLKEQSEEAQKKQEALETKVSFQSKVRPVQPKEYTISAENLAPYLTGVVRIKCDDVMGSGSLWRFPDIGDIVLTNKHVIEKPYLRGNCLVYVDSIDRSKKTNDFYLIGLYQVFPSYNISSYKINYNVDIKALEIKKFIVDGEDAPNFLLITNLNYNISSLSKCENEMPLGSPIVIIGYPAFAQKEITILGYKQIEAARTITNGIISAYDSTDTGMYGTLPYSNYFISAKIDSGNSGGIAFSKDENGLCILGVPTWLNIGNYDTQGLVQNIHNLIY